MSKNHYIYKITNLINNKIYIGRRSTSKDIEKDYYMGSGIYLKSAQKKHGIKNFKKDILEIHNDFDTLKEREIFWIKELSCTNQLIGYNLSIKSIGAGVGEDNSFYGKKHTQDTKDKISKINTGRKHSKELVNRLRELRKRENLSQETLDRKSESVTGNKNPFFGKNHSEESKEKIRKKKIGKKLSNESIDNMRLTLLNKPKFNCKFCNRVIGGGLGNLNKHELACKIKEE